MDNSISVRLVSAESGSREFANDIKKRWLEKVEQQLDRVLGELPADGYLQHDELLVIVADITVVKNPTEAQA
jgi:hypothetical protein